MIKVYDSQWGKEHGWFEFDYAGTYPGYDALIINAKIRLFDKGFSLLSEISGHLFFMEWDKVCSVKVTGSENAVVEIAVDEGFVRLERAKLETDLNGFMVQLKHLLNDRIAIEHAAFPKNAVVSLPDKLSWGNYEVQEHRVRKFLFEHMSSDDEETVLNEWRLAGL